MPERRHCLAGLAGLAALAAVAIARPAPAQDAAWSIDTLLAKIAQRRAGTAAFTETRRLAVLSQPVQSSGSLKFVAPDFLEMRTTQPVQQTVTVQGDTLCIATPPNRNCVQLSAHPEIAGFITVIRAALAGDRAALARDYSLALSGQPAQWTLTLTPRQPGPIRDILIQGGGGTIEQLQILNTNNDQSVIAIRPTP